MKKNTDSPEPQLNRYRRVSGRSPDQSICDAIAYAVLQMHILSRGADTLKKTEAVKIP